MSHAAASLQKLWGNRMTGVVRVKTRRGGWCGSAQRPGCEARLSGGGGGSAKMTLTDIYVYVTIVNLLGGVLLVVGADLGASAQVASERLRLSSSRPSTPLARRSSGTGSVKAPWREAPSPFPYSIPIHPPPCIDADYRSPNHLRLLPAPWLCAKPYVGQLLLGTR